MINFRKTGDNKGINKIRVLIIANEPTPYNIDLFNAFAKHRNIDFSVIYTKENAIENTHNFKEFPTEQFVFITFASSGFKKLYKAIIKIFKAIIKPKQIVINTGYVSAPYIFSILTCITLKIPFALLADHFNLGKPTKGGFILKPLRDFFRKLIFHNAFAILASGKTAIEEALMAGCPYNKLCNFPYVVDVNRFKSCINNELPIVKKVIKQTEGRTKIFFSGQLIKRKGLDVLLKALINIDIKIRNKLFLIVEGEGPLKKEYQNLAKNLGIEEICLFTGFNQMNEHSSLINISDIVVVPSYYDPWGIVVHEGMFLGKPVIGSNKVGAALDRINNGENGFIFSSGKPDELAEKLILLMKDRKLRITIEKKAKETAEMWVPEKNVKEFLKMVKSNGL